MNRGQQFLVSSNEFEFEADQQSQSPSFNNLHYQLHKLAELQISVINGHFNSNAGKRHLKRSYFSGLMFRKFSVLEEPKSVTCN